METVGELDDHCVELAGLVSRGLLGDGFVMLCCGR